VKLLKNSSASSFPSFHQNTYCQNPSPYLTPIELTLFHLLLLLLFSFSCLSSLSFCKSLSVTFVRIKAGITWAACCLSLPPHHHLLPHQHHCRHPLILSQEPPSTAPPWLTIRYSPTFTYSVFIVWLLRKKEGKFGWLLVSVFKCEMWDPGPGIFFFFSS
jgi:hypothetical protein